MHYDVDIYKEFNSKLESIWGVFENECEHYVFQCYDWLSHWQNTVGSNYLQIVPCITVVSDNSIPVALFPFGVRKRFGARILEFLGGDQTDYNSPLIHPDYSKNELSNRIWESTLHHLPIHDIQLFHKLPERLNHVKNPIFHFWECKPVNNAYAATLAKSWSVYEKQLSKKIRNDSKRQLRRLSKHGNLQFLIAKTDKDYDRFSSAMIAQKRQRFQDTGARDILSNIYTQKFYSGLRGKIAKKGMVHLSVLLLDNNILSTHWGVVYGDRFYFLLPTFDSGLWSKYSTGRLLQEKIIKWSIDNDFKVFDFTIGGEQYKKTWCNQRMSIYSSEKLVSIFGLIYFILSKFAILLKTNLITRKYLMKINSKIMFLRKK